MSINPPEGDWNVKSKEKNVHWYEPDLETINEPARFLLERYSGIPPEKVLSHVLTLIPQVQTIIDDVGREIEPGTLIEQKQTLLDMGCCFAQDIRKLVSDGAPSENICGAELRAQFIDLSYDLFKDRDTLKSKFYTGDILDDSPASWFTELQGELDMIYAASIFHLFNWPDQIRMAERVVGLLKPAKGSMVFGRQRGNANPAEYKHRTNEKGTMFRHNEESWKNMWGQVGETTGTKWDVRVRLLRGKDDSERAQAPKTGNDGNTVDEHDGSLRFEVIRL